MSLNVISISDLIRSIPDEEDIKKLLFSFVTRKKEDSAGADDVEYFLHNKAIQFEKMDLARTYLAMSSYKEQPALVGYFSISLKPLTISKKNFRQLSNSLQKRLMGFGHKTDQATFVIQAYLLGQLGKNFSEEALAANSCSGSDLLQLAYRKVVDAHRVVGGRILYLECENVKGIIDFYKRNGFNQIEAFESDNGYCMMVKQLSDIL